MEEAAATQVTIDCKQMEQKEEAVAEIPVLDCKNMEEEDDETESQLVDCKREECKREAEEDEDCCQTIENKEQKRQQKQSFDGCCNICGKKESGHYKYYNAYCCESCKQFFRRIVVKEKDFHCYRNNKCRMDQILYCQGCRLDCCLRMGMEPSMVKTDRKDDPNVNRQFVAQLEQRKRYLLEQSSESKSSCSSATLVIEKFEANFTTSEDMAYGNALLQLVNGHWHIWRSSTELPFSYVFRHVELADFLVDKNCIFAKLELFSPKMPTQWDKQCFIEQVEQFGLNCPDLFEYFLSSFMLALEVEKQLPFVKQLEVEDQRNLLHHSTKLVSLFFNVFYSMESGADTMITNNGLTFISALVDTKRFGGDQKLRTMGELVCCAPVQKFKLAGIERDEFCLLIAILVANAAETAVDISAGAREFLYDESVRLMGILFRLLQHKHGHFPGSARFATVVDLLSMPLKYGHDQHLLCLYLGVFYQQTITIGRKKEPKFIRELWDHDFWINIH